MELIEPLKKTAVIAGRAAYGSSAGTALLAMSAPTQASVLPTDAMPLTELSLWVGIGCAIFTAVVSTGATVVFKWLEYRANIKAKAATNE